MATALPIPANALLGFGTVYQSDEADQVGVWLTSPTGPLSTGHTNAVVTTPDDRDTIDALLNRRIVVVPQHSASVLRNPVPVDELHILFRNAVVEQEERVDAAVAEHARAARNRNLVRPDWRHEPKLSQPVSAAIAHRTLAIADHVAALWGWWLTVEDERRKRVSFPTMTAAGLADPHLALLPTAVIQRGL